MVLLGLCPKELKTGSQHVGTRVHSSITHSGQKVGTAHVAVDGRMYKEKAVPPYNRKALSRNGRDVSTQAAARTNLEASLPRDISPSRKDSVILFV